MYEFKDVKQELNYEITLRKKCSSALKGIEKLSIAYYIKNGKRYYRSYQDGKYSYLGSESSQAVIKQKKRYLMEQMIGRIDDNIELMQSFMNKFKEINPYIIQKEFKAGYQNIPSEFCKELGFIEPGLRSGSANPKYKDGLLHTTASGIAVRSRIEAIIADIYTSKGIPFSYEKLLVLADGTFIYPDFTIKSRKTGKLIYHEHVGMLSDGDYLKGFLWKLQKYIQFNIYPFDSLLLTFEKADGSIDAAEIGALIDLYC